MIALLLAAALSQQPSPEPPVFYGFRRNFSFGDLCRTEERNPAEVSWCRGYVDGMAEALMTFGRVCPPNIDRISGVQVNAVVRRYLEAHPELWDRPPIFLVDRALSEAFPCSQVSR